MPKSHAEKLADFALRWAADMSGRFEIVASDGQRIPIYDCYPSFDRSNLLEDIHVNFDSPGRPEFIFKPAEIVSIDDVELNYQVVGPEAK